MKVLSSGETTKLKSSSESRSFDSNKKIENDFLPFTFLIDSVPSRLPNIPSNQKPETVGYVKASNSSPELKFVQQNINFPVETQKKEEKQTPTEAAISKLINDTGGISAVSNVAAYVELLKDKNNNLETRSTLIAILLESVRMIHESFISNGGLFVLDDWLGEEDTKLIGLVLKLLAQLPIDMQSLKENGNIGKTVGKLSMHKDKKIKKQAKGLLRAWKKLVDNAVQAKVSQKKRKNLNGREEPTTKVPRISNAFRTNVPSVGSTELKVVKRNPCKDNQSENDTSVKPNYKPIRRLLDDESLSQPSVSSPNSTPTLRNSYDSLRSSTSSQPDDSFTMPDLKKKPGASCLPDPTKKRRVRSISWAPDEVLVRVKHFPRDKTLALDNPNMRMIKARIAAAQSQAQAQAQAQAAQNIAGTSGMAKVDALVMKPSIRWRPPVPINLPSSIKVAMGENSKEIAVQRERERTVLKVRYEVRHIPFSPGNDNPGDPPLRDDEIPKIPLYDLMKQQVAAPPAATPSYYNYNNPPSSEGPYYPQQTPTESDVLNILKSGKIGPEVLQSIMSNPTQENIQHLRDLMNSSGNNNSTRNVPLHILTQEMEVMANTTKITTKINIPTHEDNTILLLMGATDDI
eukprot:CAMPEP_0117012772 /NCGR_PEP_ID=MMETSP0472-20121206/10676_1 /TAXON_ID=693140 ORGANISM="Tiarina fusus, Strain LIS" /NCGR_SAMPLE_ID=MMETSP0472 /ASSEMBLY_ACC=CAM_ASM_000603 /LENGTH=629 /DNA_ID=CAMNT_0004715923 /DNA_START=207 /DNA_END=2097 /DNA_ORIENTATION=-